MTLLQLTVPALLAAIIVLVMTPGSAALAIRLGAVDRPEPRKIHLVPIPRLGGLAVVAGVLTAWLALYFLMSDATSSFPPAVAFGTTLGLMPVLVASLADDICGCRAIYRLSAQLLGACVAVASGAQLGSSVHLFGQPIPIGWLSGPLSVLWIVGLTNAFNLADGLDGLSAGLGLISAAALAAIAAATSGIASALPASVVVGALVGFLPYNLYPARVFLGDVGSTSIGFMLACLALSSGGRLSSGLAVLVPVLVMGVPIAETLISMARRVLRRLQDLGEGGIFEADRDHFHHRLLAMGLNQRRATLVLWAAGIGAAGVGLASMFVTALNAALLLVALLVAAFVSLQRLGYDEFALVRRGVLLRLYDHSVLKLNAFRVFVDLAAVAASMYVAVGLKYDHWSFRALRTTDSGVIAILGLCTVVAFVVSGVYKRSWRAASVEDIMRVAVAVVMASALGFLLAGQFGMEEIGFGLFGTYVFVITVAVASIRSSYKVLDYFRSRNAHCGNRTALYGAGVAGRLALAELVGNQDLGLQPVGFIDDHPAMCARYVQGYPVLGSLETLDRTLAEHHIRMLVVTSVRISQERVDEATEICRRHGVLVRRFRISLDEVGAEGWHVVGNRGARVARFAARLRQVQERP